MTIHSRLFLKKHRRTFTRRSKPNTQKNFHRHWRTQRIISKLHLVRRMSAICLRWLSLNYVSYRKKAQKIQWVMHPYFICMVNWVKHRAIESTPTPTSRQWITTNRLEMCTWIRFQTRSPTSRTIRTRRRWLMNWAYRRRGQSTLNYMISESRICGKSFRKKRRYW